MLYFSDADGLISFFVENSPRMDCYYERRSLSPTLRSVPKETPPKLKPRASEGPRREAASE